MVMEYESVGVICLYCLGDELIFNVMCSSVSGSMGFEYLGWEDRMVPL